jgi:hypothetical protein
MEESSARSTQKFSAFTPNLSFEFREKFLIVLANSVHKTGNQQVMTRLWDGQKSGDEFAGTGALPFGASEPRGINEGSRFTSTIEKPFFVQTIECGHDRRVGQRTRKFIDNVANVAVAAGPQNFHDAFFKMT